jgi:hypothetical protein
MITVASMYGFVFILELMCCLGILDANRPAWIQKNSMDFIEKNMGNKQKSGPKAALWGSKSF